MAELEFIQEFKKSVEKSNSAFYTQVGIGDDCAVLNSKDSGLLVTTDMLLDGVHFSSGLTPWRLIGRKALAVNLSDIAAMGGQPLYAFVSLGIPKGMGGLAAQQIMAGIHELATSFATEIAGGDTNSWRGPLAINVTLIGRPCSNPIKRSGARIGDWIFVTGPLGGSIFGKHLQFVPRLELAGNLSDNGPIHAMIDISDGLASDLSHILNASECGADLNAADIPISEECKKYQDSLSPLDHALYDGEDFELCFTTSASVGQRLIATSAFKSDLFKIGVISREKGLRLWQPDGVPSEVEGRGYQHQF